VAFAGLHGSAGRGVIANEVRWCHGASLAHDLARKTASHFPDHAQLAKARLRSPNESQYRDRLHAPRSPAVLRTARCGADADGSHGQAPAPDDRQYRQDLAGIADPELVQLRSEA